MSTNVNTAFEKWKYKRYFILMIGVFMMMLIGIPYAWSVFNAPIAKEFSSFSQAQLQFTFTMFMISYGIFGIVGGYLVTLFKTVRYNLMISAGLIFLSFWTTSCSTELWQFYLGFGVLGGAGVVFAYNAIIVNLTRWFLDRLGIATGFLMMGYGIGSFIMGNVFTALVSAGFEWRAIFLVFGVVIALVTFVGGLFMKYPPEDYVTPERKAYIDKTPLETMECTPIQMIRRPSFWILIVHGTFTMMAVMGVISCARNYVLSVNPDLAPSTVAIVVGILSVASAVGRISTGFLNDYGGTKLNLRVSTIAVAVSTLLVALAVWSNNYTFLIISFICAGFSAGMGADDGAVVVRKLYGGKYYQINFEILMANGMLHAFASTFVGGMYDLFGGYVLPLFILAGCGIIGVVASFCVKKP